MRRSLPRRWCWRTSSCPSWASLGWTKRSCSGCWRSASRIARRHSYDSLSMSPCNGAAGRPTACWASRTATLPRGGRAAPRLPLLLLPPEGGLLPLAQPPPAALREPAKWSAPAPQPLLFVGVPAAPPTPPFPPAGSRKSCRRIPGRLRQVPPLPAGAGTAPLGDDGDPQRGGLAAPTTLPSPPRGHPAAKTRSRPQELPKPGPGQQPGHVPARKSTRRLSGVYTYHRK